jgi:integration host factor subunit alpha
MSDQTVTRARLTETVYQEVGLARNEAAALVEAVIAEISGALERGEMVKISSFGTFAVRQKGPRVGRNPKTKQEAPIANIATSCAASPLRSSGLPTGLDQPARPNSRCRDRRNP